jgi:hypothetical protein
MLTYNELKILEKEVNRLKERGEILDPRNSFERRELHAIIQQLKAIALSDEDRKRGKRGKLVRTNNYLKVVNGY